jgi:hypothetical protein
MEGASDPGRGEWKSVTAPTTVFAAKSRMHFRVAGFGVSGSGQAAGWMVPSVVGTTLGGGLLSL